MTLDAFLAHVSPTVARHPLSLAFRTLVLSKAAFLALVRGQTLTLWTSLQKKYQNKVPVSKAQGPLQSIFPPQQ